MDLFTSGIFYLWNFYLWIVQIHAYTCPPKVGGPGFIQPLQTTCQVKKTEEKASNVADDDTDPPSEEGEEDGQLQALSLRVDFETQTSCCSLWTPG